MKAEIKLFEVIDQIGYSDQLFKSKRDLSYIARYFIPVYHKMFGLPYGVDLKDFNSLDHVAAMMIQTKFPGKLETTILPEWMGGLLQFDTVFTIDNLATSSYTFYHFFLQDLGDKQPWIIEKTAYWILKFLLEYTPIGYNEFDYITESAVEWTFDMDEEDADFHYKELDRIKAEVDQSKTFITKLAHTDFDISLWKVYYDYFKSKSRHPKRKEYMKLLKKFKRFHDIIDGKPIPYQSSGELGGMNCGDMFCISLTSSDFIYEQLNDQVTQTEEIENANITITYNPETDKYSIEETDFFKVRYSISLYEQFLKLYYG